MIQFAIEKANRVLVIAHVDPDGDAIGSLTAAGQALQQLGKRVTPVSYTHLDVYKRQSISYHPHHKLHMHRSRLRLQSPIAAV